MTAPSGSDFKAFIGDSYLQTVNYRYNIRGQLLSINNSKLTNDGGVTSSDSDDVFGMQMFYDQAGDIGNTAKYNGRLTGVKWMSLDAGGAKSYERRYNYGYDDLGRYTAARYAERTTTGTGSFSNNIGGFDERSITYDENGNLLTLSRNSSTQGTNSNIQVDTLGYTYDSNNPNRLLKVADGTGSNYTGYGFRNLTGAPVDSAFTYDANGNLRTDPYKGLALYYNDLNRTSKTIIRTATNRFINYTYDATGVLLRKEVYDNNTLQTTTDYVDGFVYTTTGAGSASLAYFPMPEGRVINTGSALKCEYIITDQQGNARVSFQENPAMPGQALVTQENSYYGYGLQLANSPVGLPTNPNKNLYNGGSEWQNDYSNLPDYYQTFYRNYDAALGRFVGVDPMPESAESLSVYHYANLNPVTYNDPMGDDAALQQVINSLWDNAKDHNSAGYTWTRGGGEQPLQTDGDAFYAAALEIYLAVGPEGGSGIPSYEKAAQKFNSHTHTGNDAPVGWELLNPVTITAMKNLVPALQAEAYRTKWYDFYKPVPFGTTVTVEALNGRPLVTVTPWAKTVVTQYTAKVYGKKGTIGTTNVSFNNTLGKNSVATGIDQSLGPIGVSVDREGGAISLSLGESTYTFGLTEEGIIYGSSIEKEGTVNGQTTLVSPTPLTGIAAFLGSLIKDLPELPSWVRYIPETVE